MRSGEWHEVQVHLTMLAGVCNDETTGDVVRRRGGEGVDVTHPSSLSLSLFLPIVSLSLLSLFTLPLPPHLLSPSTLLSLR
jgi:hypothetical protein